MNLIFLMNTVFLSQRIPVEYMYLEDLRVREEMDVPVSLVFSKILIPSCLKSYGCKLI